MYKIRYKPFFSRVESIIAALVPGAAPQAETRGVLSVGVIEARGLCAKTLTGATLLHAAVAIGEVDWVGSFQESDGAVYLIRDLVHIKSTRKEATLQFTLAM
jgi:hypothetical protein